VLALKFANFGNFSIFFHLLNGQLGLLCLDVVLLSDELFEMRLGMLYEEVDFSKGTICPDPTHRAIIILVNNVKHPKENSLYYIMIKFT
jgi:hypothetical protein